MIDVPEKCLDDFVAGARRVARHNLVQCGSGNLSWRIDDTRMLITARHSWMIDLTKDDVAVCRIADGAVLSDNKPSVERGFHAGGLRERTEMNVVLHFLSPWATVQACRHWDAEGFFIIPEAPFYVGPVATVPYWMPGSDDLARAVTSALKDHDMVLLWNHGQVTVGKDFNDAIEKAVFFDVACEILVKGGDDVHRLSPEAVADLREAAEDEQSQAG